LPSPPDLNVSVRLGKYLPQREVVIRFYSTDLIVLPIQPSSCSSGMADKRTSVKLIISLEWNRCKKYSFT
jgi:hypothetical protein